jgi:hypothetical protein
MSSKVFHFDVCGVYGCIFIWFTIYFVFSIISMVYVLLLSEVGGSVGDTVFTVFELVLALLCCVIFVFGVCVWMFLAGRL